MESNGGKWPSSQFYMSPPLDFNFLSSSVIRSGRLISPQDIRILLFFVELNLKIEYRISKWWEATSWLVVPR